MSSFAISICLCRTAWLAHPLQLAHLVERLAQLFVFIGRALIVDLAERDPVDEFLFLAPLLGEEGRALGQLLSLRIPC